MVRFLATMGALLALITPALSAGDGDGGYGGAFYQVPLGARPTAMGGAYRAISNDGAAPLFNPAGLSLLDRTLVASSYRAMQLDRQLGYLTFMFPVQGQTAIGGHWLYAGSGKVRERDSDGFDLGRDFSLNHHQFSVVFAKRFEKYLAVGANLSYLYAKFPEVVATGVGFDFGGLLFVDELIDREKRDDMPVKDIRLALTIKHIGKEFAWNSEKYNARYSGDAIGYEQTDKVPVEFALGSSARFFARKLLLAADVSMNEKQGPIAYAGAEFFLRPEFALRAGYYQKRFTAGTGYVFTFGSVTMAVDYAFSTDRVDEGSEHIFSFDFLL
ncbi:MAG: PorV/PorQ family protein [candidate division Zixibacteria bacterium]|nr:PorV/PorQ family protein [candidate division Zixibacteria bacterium]